MQSRKKSLHKIKNVEIQNLSEYHDLCLQRDTFLLVDIFKIFEIRVVKYMNSALLVFLTAPRLV